MFNVLIADRFPEEKLDELRGLGLHVQYDPQLSAETLPQAIAQQHILCVRSTRVTEATIQQARRLNLIIRVGSGTNTIDVKAASRRGIYVANCPGKNAIAVAELTMGLLIATDRHIPQGTAALREGRWNKKEFAKATGLKGMKLGIVGLGQIGHEVAKRARSFGMNLLAWSLDFTPEQAKQWGIQRCETLEELCSQAEVISVHLPLTPQTKGIFGKYLFDRMRPGTIFINTARGELHDELALEHAVRNRGLRVGLDVYNNEPAKSQGEFAPAIAQHTDSFVGTHHIGASTKEAQLAVASEAIRIMQRFIQRGEVPNCINLAREAPARCKLIVRHYDKVGVLAAIMDALRKANINIQEMSNKIFHEGETAVATMQLNEQPPPALIEELEAMKEMVIQAYIT